MMVKVLDFLAADTSVVKVNRIAITATKDVICFMYFNIFLSLIYLLTNNSK